jgi:uncharacterized protein
MTTRSVRPSMSGWPHASSPFHDGERQAQMRAGVADQLDGPGRRMIRDFMPDEHRELFSRLPYLIVGAADDQGHLWAAMLAGTAGFVRCPDSRTLEIRARPLPGDPMGKLITVGRPTGFLGIELSTRRRNRANGELIAIDDRSITARITQSFGNCPQYIQARSPIATERSARTVQPQIQGRQLGEAAIAVIRNSDTFFIATATSGSPKNPNEGVDVSHRGGRPGFVAVEQRDDGTVLTAPDFRGNFLFNTLGNLEVNPNVGVLFVDFETGTMVSLTGEAKASWDDSRTAHFEGAQRMLELRVHSGVVMPEAWPWRWSRAAMAPQLRNTGVWPDAISS